MGVIGEVSWEAQLEESKPKYEVMRLLVFIRRTPGVIGS